jgi:hypothetical protein
MMRKFDDITEPEDLNPEQMQLEFAPGCFDEFDGTQEELDEFIAELQRMFNSGEFAKQSRPVTEDSFKDLSPEMQQKLIDFLDDEPPPRNLN